jgi:hypothetical protein
MAKRLLSIQEETPAEEEMRTWVETQKLEGPKAIEEAARLLIGLISALLGALFAVLTVSAEHLPAYLHLPLIRWSGISAVCLWLLSLLAGLVVILPRRWLSFPGRPEKQQRTFQQLLAFKSGWLLASVICFGLAVVALGIVLVAALLAV